MRRELALEGQGSVIANPRLINIVGDPGSGKDLVIQAVADLGSQHAVIIPKHTSRARRGEDRGEMICSDDPGYDFNECDLVYENYGTQYGLKTSEIWDGLQRGVFVITVISNVKALNRLKLIFGELLVLTYVHSQSTAEEFLRTAETLDGYVESRVERFRMAFDLYVDNFLAFDHVLIWSDDRENLFDQIFRLFRAYELSYR